MMRTQISIETELLEKLRVEADKDKILLENLIEVLIIDFLNDRGYYEKE